MLFKNKIKIYYNHFKEYFLYFMGYAIIGWIYEVVLEVFIYKWGFTNRGVLFGPYLPVYGFGALAFILTIYRLIKNKKLKNKIKLMPLVFVGCMLISTLIELLTSYICEFTMGYWPWQTYAEYAINFQARIALSPSIRFGIGGVIFLYLVQPFFEKLYINTKPKTRNIIFYILFIIIIIDVINMVIN